MDTSLSQPISLPQSRRWVFSICQVSRKIIFFLFPITPFLGLSEGLQLPIPLGDFDYMLTVSGLLNLATCVLFIFFLLHNLKPFRFRAFLPGTLFLISYLTMIRSPYLFDGVMDWLRVAGWIATTYIVSLVLDKGEQDLSRMFKLALFASIAPFLLSLMTYMMGVNHIGWFGTLSKDPTLGTYMVNVASRSAAGYLLVLVPFIFFAAFLYFSARVQLASVVWGLASFVAIWFSYGRALLGGFVAFLAPILLVSRFRKLSFVFIFVCLPLLILMNWHTMRLRFTDTPIIKNLSFMEGEKIVAGTEEEGYWFVDPSEKTVKDWERVIIWWISLSLWWDGGTLGRLFGLGPRSIYDNGRNVFIGLLAEAGPAALGFFLFFLGSIIVSSWRLYRMAEMPYQKILALLSLCSLVSFLFVSIFDVPIRGFDVMWYRAIIWGMALGECRRLTKRIYG